jgi:hypothetical protein
MYEAVILNLQTEEEVKAHRDRIFESSIRA